MQRPRRVRGVMAVLVTLIVMGIVMGATAGIARALHPSTLGVRAEPVRARVWKAFGLQEPFPDARQQQVLELESRFAAHPAAIAAHAGIGALFLVAGFLQFVDSIRTRHVRFHRWNGRVLLAAGFAIAVTGFYFGVVIPAAGLREAAIIGIVSLFFAVSLVNGVVSIRRMEVRMHREWMIRAFAVAVGISTVRIVAVIADATLTPRGVALEDVFVLSLAVGWGITLTAAELWIIHTRKILDSAVPATV